MCKSENFCAITSISFVSAKQVLLLIDETAEAYIIAFTIYYCYLLVYINGLACTEFELNNLQAKFKAVVHADDALFVGA
jgi:hypothetical protein